MKPTVYLETSIIGYLTSRPSRDLVTAANQQLTSDWWHQHRHRFELYISHFVVAECTAGDQSAAQDRLAVLAGVVQLDVNEDVAILAAELMSGVPLPDKAEVDALHISVATVNGVDFLLTWNCTHIANAAIRHRIESICRSLGFEPPTICTPQELLDY
jgi:hypothetical protein